MADNTIGKSFPVEFIDLLKQGGQDEKVKSMIKDQALHNVVDTDGTRALHLAAKFNNTFGNTRIIDFLIELGCDTEVEDSSGTTPLMTALLCGNFLAAKAMLYHRVVGLSDESWKAALYAKPIYMFRVAADLTSKLRRHKKSFGPEQIGEFLARVDCCLCAVIKLQDPAITKGFLRSEVRTYFYALHQSILFERIMPTLDMQYLRMILHDGRWPKEWTSLLCSYVVDDILNYQKTQAGRDFLRRIFSWQIFNEDNIECLEKALRRTKKENIKIFLQYNFHSSVKEKFGRDVMMCLFGNWHPKIVPYMLKNGVIRLDGRDHENNTLLHYAAREMDPGAIKFLLKNGADPNALNDLSETPVTLVLNEDFDELECLKPLLIAGADHLRTCAELNQRLSFGEMGDFYVTDEFFASQLAIYEALGLSTEKPVRDLHDNEECPELQTFYEECRRQLKLLKTKEIKMNFNMFAVLVEKPMRIARHFSEEDLQAIAVFVKSNRKTVYSYYRETLKQHATDIAKINLCRHRVIGVICKYIGIDDPTHLVVRKIADYFSFSDLLNFEKYKF